MRIKGILKLILFLSLGVLAIIPHLYSQTDVEKATRETDRLGREKIGEKLRKIPEKPAELKPEEAAPPKEEQKFFIKKINLSGVESFSPEVFRPIIEKYENREITLSDLDSLSKEIERDYLRKGVIAAVFVPPQEIKEGIVTLRVVEARMGELKIQEHKYFSKDRLSYYWRLPEGEILRYDKIATGVQLMNKNPDRRVKAALHAGKKPGTTDILLVPQTIFPLHTSFTYDREGATSTGHGRMGYGLRHNNFLGLDDTLLSGYTFGNAFSGIYTYHNLPLGYNGASLVYGYSRSESVPKKEFATSNIKSEAKNLSFSLHQDLYKEGNYWGEVFFGFDAKDKNIKQNTGTYNKDKLRIFSLGANFIQRGFASATYISPEFSHGVDGLGSTAKGNPYASRGAKSVFGKFTLGIQHKRVLPFNLQANLKLNTQLTTVKLTPQEEFSLGGMDSIRGYPSGDYLADNAALTNVELLFPMFFIPKKVRLPYAAESLGEQITGLIFVDYGWGRRRGRIATEKKYVEFLGVGPGLRIRLFDQLLLRLEWGFPYGHRPLTEQANSRFHFSLDFQDKLPQEFERIRKMIEEENIKYWAWQILNKELAQPESPLRQKLFNYRYLAQTLYKQGRLSEAKEVYARLAQIGESLYQQAQEYVRACLLQQKELKASHRLARAYYKAGKIDQAKQLWQKLINEASPRPLVLEF